MNNKLNFLLMEEMQIFNSYLKILTESYKEKIK